MLKFLFAIMITPILFNSMPKQFENTSQLKAYNNGQEIVIESEQATKIAEELTNIFSDARPAPAFCVSLDEEVKKEIQQGLWLEFKFDSTIECDDMTYDTLLMRITKGTSGVNLIRGNNNNFTGRCYYFDLENNFDSLYDYLLTLNVRHDKQGGQLASMPSVPKEEEKGNGVI